MRRALEILRSAEERMKIAEGRLGAFIERPDRQYSPGERVLPAIDRTEAL